MRADSMASITTRPQPTNTVRTVLITALLALAGVGLTPAPAHAGWVTALHASLAATTMTSNANGGTGSTPNQSVDTPSMLATLRSSDPVTCSWSGTQDQAARAPGRAPIWSPSKESR